MKNKVKSFVFDLDGVINHVEKIPHGLMIKGSVTHSFIAPCTLEMLALLSQRINLFVNTARSESYIHDFIRHFSQYEVHIEGWILEHGTVVLDKPNWTKTVLKDIDLEQIHEHICKLSVDKHLAIDLNCYYHNHKGFLLYAGNGEQLKEHFTSSLHEILKDKFRILMGKRKIAIIPNSTDKYIAFNHNFGQNNEISFAAGDSNDDLTLLKHAYFPLTLTGASEAVKNYVKSKKGYISPNTGHAGIYELVNTVYEMLIFEQ